MNENLDLTKILRCCQKGTVLYSPIFGEVEFKKITKSIGPDGKLFDSFIAVRDNSGNGITWCFSPNGKFSSHNTSGECMLFPSREQRDWSKFNPNIKPKFKAGDRIVDVTRDNNHTYEVIEVLEDRYKVTGFDTLLFCDQDEFELSPVQIEMLEPQKIYWFVWEQGVTEPLLNKLMELVDSAYQPCCLKDGDVLFNEGDKIIVRNQGDTSAMIATMFGIQLRIKEEK